MPPTVSGASRRTRAGRRRVPVALLLALCLGARPSAAACPPPCLCASDIISCSGRNLSALPFELPGYAAWLDLSHNALAALRLGWISGSFQRLATLVLNRNAVRLIQAEAFAAMPRLAHLDLSSNRLTALEANAFAGLGELRELLLFGNQIARVDPGALRDLRGLQRVYLSGNRLTDYPPGLLSEAGGPRNLSLLDLSSNRLAAVPVPEVLMLSRSGRVYLQGNPLGCDCPLRALLEYWSWKRYDPLLDFRGQFPCLDEDDSASECVQLAAPDVPLEAAAYRVEPGRRLQVPCQGSGGPNATAIFWVTPTAVLSPSADDPRSNLAVFPNGTLEIRSAGAEDSGVYACVAPRGGHRGPPEVSVVVANGSSASTTRGSAHRSSSEHFNTAFTTLASCVVSIVLVLLYLYLTPCRCRDNQGGRRCGGRALILCSDPREVEAGQRRSNGKRVAFLEPQTEDGGQSVSKSPYSGHVATEGILKNGSRTVEEPLGDPAP